MKELSITVLSQVQDGQEKVIAFGSKMLSKTKRNYCITRWELLAVVHFVSQFRHFLSGQHFLVRTANSAVRSWTKIHADSYDPQRQTAQWLVRLAAFDFDIKHRTGRQHNNADGMSHLPMLQCMQCETRLQGAYEMKLWKKVDMITVCSSTQTEGGKTTRVKAQKRGKESKFARDAQTEMVRVLTRSQRLKSPKNLTNPS